MSQEVTTYSRKATFKSTGVKGSRVFTAVNKRGHTVVAKGGRRKYITEATLKSFVGKGSYTFHAYTATGALKPIKF